MNLHSRFRKPTRIREYEIDTAAYAPAGREDYYGPYEDMPVYYAVAVQVKVWIFWITIWEESVDATDADGRNIICERAKQVHQKLIADE